MYVDIAGWHLFLRDMLARGRGRILNVASTAAWLGIPQQNVYAASKAYVVSFTLALEDEVRSKGRGVAKNPVDHPLGGGEGRTSGGRHPVTPWGKPTKGYKTRNRKVTDKFIVQRRQK
mgnify:CR=1 FL=1